MMSISPYALLQASKPQPPKSVTTQYDLFSMTQSDPPSDIPTPASIAKPAPSKPLPGPARTHYIRDIHTRHADASRSCLQHHGSL